MRRTVTTAVTNEETGSGLEPMADEFFFGNSKDGEGGRENNGNVPRRRAVFSDLIHKSEFSFSVCWRSQRSCGS
jgi:hypothetical protein